jgi:hypothetical protein
MNYNMSLLCFTLKKLIDQKLLTLPEHMSSPPVFSGVRVTRSLVLCVCFVDRCLSFCTFFLAIVSSVLLRLTDSDYHFGIFKLFCFEMVTLLYRISFLTKVLIKEIYRVRVMVFNATFNNISFIS